MLCLQIHKDQSVITLIFRWACAVKAHFNAYIFLSGYISNLTAQDFIYIYIWLYIDISYILTFLRLSIYLSIYHLSICLSFYLSIYLSIYLSVTHIIHICYILYIYINMYVIYVIYIYIYIYYTQHFDIWYAHKTVLKAGDDFRFKSLARLKIHQILLKFQMGGNVESWMWKVTIS